MYLPESAKLCVNSLLKSSVATSCPVSWFLESSVALSASAFAFARVAASATGSLPARMSACLNSSSSCLNSALVFTFSVLQIQLRL
jgi:hypothetical protein